VQRVFAGSGIEGEFASAKRSTNQLRAPGYSDAERLERRRKPEIRQRESEEIFCLVRDLDAANSAAGGESFEETQFGGVGDADTEKAGPTGGLGLA